MKFELDAIGFVKSTRTEETDEAWGSVTSSIELVEPYTKESIAGLWEFSHLEVIFTFLETDPDELTNSTRRPQGNPTFPKVGIFAQRGRNRPNLIGTTICRIIDITGSTIHVANLDAVDGTPVLDIKPVLQEFLPTEPVSQPDWSHEVMKEYW